MNNIETIPANVILEMTSYVQLFSANREKLKKEYRHLTLKWHPDRNTDPRANDVFIKVRNFYEVADAHLKVGLWGSSSILKFDTPRNSEVSISYFKAEEMPGFGHQYVGKKEVIYHIPDSNLDLARLWEKNFAYLKGKLKDQPRMSAEFQTTLDAYPICVEVNDGLLIRIQKPRNFISLKHIHEKSPLDVRHVVWILSRLCSLAALMEFIDLPNLDISLQSIFIEPANHQIVLLNGWQYANKFKEKIVAAPRRIRRLCPDLDKTGIVIPKHISVQIKNLGKELLGDKTGVMLLKRKDVPREFTTWLNSPPDQNLIKAVGIWDKVKVKAFGPPKFHELNITEKDIYQ